MTANNQLNSELTEEMSLCETRNSGANNKQRSKVSELWMIATILR